MSEGVRCASGAEAGIRTLELDRPDKANTLCAEVVEVLLRHIEASCVDDTRVVVLKGSGKNFCAGFDLSDVAAQSDGDLLRRFVRIEELLQAIRHAPFLTIACAQGAVFGAGADLVAACALRVGAPNTRMRFPGFQFGVALGTRHLTRIVGAARARAMLINNESLDAQQALACGLLTHVAEVEDFDSLVESLGSNAHRLERGSLATLLNNTLEDSRDSDLAALVRSLSAPGLGMRIEVYKRGLGTKV